MKATFEDEKEVNEGYLIVFVTDNAGVKHEITFEKSSKEIVYHGQDGYPDDPAERTGDGNQHVDQARRFAKYYVQQERGYQTVAPSDHPDAINAVRLTIKNLSESEFAEQFGDLHQQLRSHHTNVDPVVELPAEVTNPDIVVYRQHISLGVDPFETELAEEARTLAADNDLSSDDISQSLTDLSEQAISAWETFTGEFADMVATQQADLSDGTYIDTVSPLEVRYPQQGHLETLAGGGSTPAQPHTTLELLPYDPGELANFKEFLDYHLRCQIRDCFIRMGLHPPAEFRVLGYGKFIHARRYGRYDMYPEYHDPNERQLLG